MIIAVTSTPSTTDLTADVSSWWDNPATRDWLIDKPVSIAVTILVALIGHWLLRKLINRAVARGVKSPMAPPKLIKPPFSRAQDTPPEIPEEARIMRRSREKRRQSRIRTLGAVGRSAAAIFVWTWAVLAVLTTLGVNVAPLIASAGVAGVALGFGAQSLVKDFLSGIFMLVEDQYGVGDTIDVGEGIIGEVEDISLRVTTLRDIDGTLWYIRNGEILRVGNLSGDFSIVRVQIPVGLSNDTEKAWSVIETSLREAVRQPEVRDYVLGDPEVKGITDFQPDYLSFRVVIKTLPGYQAKIQRHVYARIMADMQREGVTTPYPNGIGGLRTGFHDGKSTDGA
ncbi:mechanosensitive ion channel family protein [Corynebacterium pacaense]|uniref:mechanosensitive ion channel family protein n=1 Tax=Corynebacterium pacaense TaxID=1816684 RepID=UPI0009BB2911|nr:mechanosensitive ion channel family protein [Corynebacterium pacaense]